MFQNGQTELRKSVYRLFESYPKAYIDTLRVKFVRSKKAQNEEKSQKCDFSTLFYNIEFVTLPNPLIYLPFCGLDFFYLSFLLSVRVVRIMSFAGVIPGKEIVCGTKLLKQAFCLDFHGT